MCIKSNSLKGLGLGLTFVFGTALFQGVSAEVAEATSAAEEAQSDPMPEADQHAAGSTAADTAAAETTAGDSVMYDTDRGVALSDTDGDGFPDLTESLEMTNPLDASNYPGSDMPEAADEAGEPGFPASSCRSGYREAGSRLCISTNVHDARSYANAMVYCRDRRGRVASYGDLRYLYVRTSLDAAYNPNGRWIGNFVDDDRALCGNKSITSNNDPDIGNFEGRCKRFDSRNFWCTHDRN